MRRAVALHGTSAQGLRDGSGSSDATARSVGGGSMRTVTARSSEPSAEICWSVCWSVIAYSSDPIWQGEDHSPGGSSQRRSKIDSRRRSSPKLVRKWVQVYVPNETQPYEPRKCSHEKRC